MFTSARTTRPTEEVADVVITVQSDVGPVVDLGVTVDPLYKFTGEQIVDLADLDIFASDEESSPRPPTPPTSKAPAPAVTPGPG